VGGREKAPAAICRKVAEAENGGTIEIWGDGKQTRSFLYIDECIEATRKLMLLNDFCGPVNIGSEEMVSINELVRITTEMAGKNLQIKNIPGPTGVRGRNSNNDLFREKIDWNYSMSLAEGILKTYDWILLQKTTLNA
jgi:nucleoside-diphosphate-sugar epimerase